MKVIYFITLLLFFSSCRQDTLQKVSYEEFVAMINERSVPDLSSVRRVDPFGNEISLDSLGRLHRIYDLEEELYRNETGEIVEIRVKPRPPIKEIPIDCAAVDNQLDSLKQIDQAVRSEYNPKADRANLEMVVNIIEQCGMPESPGSVHAIFLILQHNHTIYQKKYIDPLKAAAERGNIGQSSIAMMEDRILVSDGKPQIYGTQVYRKGGEEAWKLYDIVEPERVNIRRAEVGLGPIEEYLKLYGLEFDVEQERE